MKQLLASILVLVGISSDLAAQRLVLESKAGLMIAGTYAVPMGASEVTTNSFAYPALLPNYQYGTGGSIQYYRKAAGIFAGGIRFSTLTFSNWKFNQEPQAFPNSKTSINSLSLMLIVRSNFHERGFLNKVTFYLGGAPGIYFINARFPEPINYAGTLPTPADLYAYSKSSRPGFLLNGGFDCALSNTMALTIDAGYHYVTTESIVYMDRSFQWLQINAGVTCRLGKNRNYKIDYD